VRACFGFCHFVTIQATIHHYLRKGHLTGQMLSTSFIVIQFSSIELLTKYALTTKSLENKQMRDFICGGMAASIGILCVQPLDVVRTRFVAQGEPKVFT
jgi:solute carrier family 25 thiamine pyrophosphate transporter 19